MFVNVSFGHQVDQSYESYHQLEKIKMVHMNQN